MDADLELYDAFVDSSPQGTLFHKSRWLETTGYHYQILTVKRNGVISAAWPITFKRAAGLNLIISPQLTPRSGMLFALPQKKKYADQISDEMEFISELIELLPRNALFCQRFSYAFTDWLPFYWSGFSQTTRYSYVIEDLSDPDRIWDNMRYGTKRKINMAQKNGIQIITDLSPDKLLDLNEMTYKRQKLAVPYSREYVYRIDQACRERNAGKTFFAVDEDGRIHAAAYIIYDKKCAYYLIGGADPSINHYGAQFLILWEAIKFAGTVSGSFDFEGSMHKNIEPVFRGYGGIQKSYMEITKGNVLIKSTFELFRNAWNKGGIISGICAKCIQ